MTRPAFNYRAFVTRWRELAADHGIDARTGEPLPVAGRPWWANPSLWKDEPPARSLYEAAAIASVSAQARAFHYEPTAKPDVVEGMIEYADQWMHEVIGNASALHDLPLREVFWSIQNEAHIVTRSVYNPRDVEVVEVEGIRVEVLKTSLKCIDFKARIGHPWRTQREATAEAV